MVQMKKTYMDIGSKRQLHSHNTFRKRFIKDLKKNKYVYIMLSPVVLYFLIFHYGPIYGIQIAFKDYRPADGIWGSEWVGFKHITAFIQNPNFWKLVKNTFLLSFYQLLFGFPAPIILALLLNEIRKVMFRRVVQTISYLPHFISLVVVAGMIIDFTTPNGIVNEILKFFGMDPISFMQRPEWFRTI